jgi:hypothetical protein
MPEESARTSSKKGGDGLVGKNTEHLLTLLVGWLVRSLIGTRTAAIAGKGKQRNKKKEDRPRLFLRVSYTWIQKISIFFFSNIGGDFVWFIKLKNKILFLIFYF